MQQISAEYLAEIARQIGALSAFLGGFAATFLVTLLTLQSARRVTSWAIASATLSSVSFIVAVIATTMLAFVLHPNAPANLAREVALTRGRVVGLLGFLLGTYALLLSLALSGWVRSRRTGWLTSSLAGLGAALVSWALLGF